MLNNILSWQFYLFFNIAIALSYIITRSIISIPLLNRSSLPSQRLTFAKTSFALTLLSMLLIPWLLTTFNINPSENFQFQPILKQTSDIVMQQPGIIDAQNYVSSSTSYLPSLNELLLSLLLTGFSIFCYQYFKSIITLKKLARESLVKKRIHNITLLVNNNIEVPFCWSLFSKHFICIPTALLEKNLDLKLAIRHEFQHLRQGDTQWLHLLALITVIFFCNPFIKLWGRWINELQEYACDEALILKKATSPLAYADCLVNVAKQINQANAMPPLTSGMFGFTKKHHLSTLHRRINMLFNYKPSRRSKLIWLIAYLFCFLSITSTAYALNNNATATNEITAQQLTNIIQKFDTGNPLQVSATPELVNEINDIRASMPARTELLAALDRMQQHQAVIEPLLKNNNVPNDFLALPMVESGYQPLPASKNPMHAAGIWQFVPSTAQKFGLVINGQHDDRLNTQLSTQAAIKYLTALYNQYHDWRLAAVAYEYGAQNTSQYINTFGTRDTWTIARSPQAPAELKSYLAELDAAVIIMHDPSLLKS